MSRSKDRLIASAQKQIQRGNYSRAIRDLRGALAIDTRDSRVRARLADMLLRQGDTAEAAKELRLVADDYRRSGLLAKAASVYKQLMEISPGQLGHHLILAEIYTELGRNGDAIQHLGVLAQAHERSGDTEELADIYEKLIRLDPSRTEHVDKLAGHYRQSGNNTAAHRLYGQLRDVASQRGDVAGATRALEAMVELIPNDRDALRGLAALYLERKKPRKALGVLQDCFRLDPQDTETLELLVSAFLLSELRGRWLRGEGLIPIEDHSILSDLRTAAIVTPQAAISWLCVPRIDSGAVFAQLLGGPSAGHFTIRDGDPSITEPLGQRYLNNTMVLETQFSTFKLTDFMDSSSGRTRRLAGRSDLIRILEGTGEAVIEFAPRLAFGRVPTRLEVRPEGIAVQGTSDLMVLRAPGVEWEIIADGSHQTAIGRVDLSYDKPVALELRSGTGTVRPDARSEADRLSDTERFWSNWVGKLELPSVERELVGRSALILKSLCHGPTGAILAAATTSLPETLGGVRNWDYRYCWLRDAALSATALARLNSHAEGMAYLDWVLQILETRSDPERLAPLYNVTGRHLPPEAEIADLPGYGSSRPVRVGNAADGQVQLDVFGPVVDLVHVLLERGEALSAEHWRLVEAMVLAVSRRWHEPDHGIWEIRKPPRHHVYSKVMCWVTVDRAISIADQFLDREPEAWVELRDQIAAEVLANGVGTTEVGSFSCRLRRSGPRRVRVGRRHSGGWSSPDRRAVRRRPSPGGRA